RDGLGFLVLGRQRRDVAFEHAAVGRARLRSVAGRFILIRGFFGLGVSRLVRVGGRTVFGRVVGVAVGFDVVFQAVDQLVEARRNAIAPAFCRRRDQGPALRSCPREAIQQFA